MSLPVEIVYVTISILSIILYVLSVQCKKKKDILIVQIGASLSYLIVYLIKAAWSGVAVEFLEELKDLVFIKTEKDNKKIPIIFLIIFITLLIAVSIYFYDGPLSLLPLIINITYFISTYFKNPKYIRLVMLINAFIWIIYNLYVEAYIIVIGNILEIISAAISLIRFKEKK